MKENLKAQYQKLHRTGKRPSLVTPSLPPEVNASILNILTLDHNIKVDCSALSPNLKCLLVDVVERGYHKMSQSEQTNKKAIEITEQEAINLVWSYVAKEIGFPFENYPIQEIQTALRNYFTQMELSSNLSFGQYAEASKSPLKRRQFEKYNDLVAERERLKEEIYMDFQKVKILHQSEEQVKKFQNQLIAQVLQTDIIRTEREIFLRSIIGIQVKDKQARIILEQCYPSMKMSVEEAVEYVGRQNFNQKVNAWNEIQKSVVDNKNIIICHICLQVIPSQDATLKCNDSMAQDKVAHVLLTDPFIYYSRILNHLTPLEDDTLSFIHPYLIYYPFERGNRRNFVCNRYICKACFIRFYKEYEVCEYCQGTCDCIRCVNMDYLTKAMAYYFYHVQDIGKAAMKIFNEFRFKIDEYSNGKLKINLPPKNVHKIQRLISMIKEEHVEIDEKEQWENRVRYFPIKEMKQSHENTKRKPQKHKIIFKNRDGPGSRKQKKKAKPKPPTEKPKPPIPPRKSSSSQDLRKGDIFYDDDDDES